MKSLWASILIFVVSLMGTVSSTANEKAPLKVHMLSGSKEYKSEDSLKAFQAELEKRFMVQMTASWVTDGAKSLK